MLLVAAATLGVVSALSGSRPVAPVIAHYSPPPARIYVNRAGIAELSALPGIGLRKAQKIMDARANAPLQTLEELARAAEGVSAANLARMKPFVVFEP